MAFEMRPARRGESPGRPIRSSRRGGLPSAISDLIYFEDLARVKNRPAPLGVWAANVVHQPGDLELLVVRRDAGEQRRALQTVGEEVDVLGVGRVGAAFEQAEQRVDVRDRRARHVAGR